MTTSAVSVCADDPKWPVRLARLTHLGGLVILGLLFAAGGIRTFGSIIGFLVAILIGYVCSRIARSKGRGSVLWFILGFFFTLISLIVILVLPSKRR
jgi:hypothetical protein